MFDSAQSTSVDLALEAPEEASSILKDESIMEEIKGEDKLDTFNDFEFISMLRTEIVEMSETAGGEDVEMLANQLPYASRSRRLFFWLLRSMGWRYFHSVSEVPLLEDLNIAEQTVQKGPEEEIIEEPLLEGEEERASIADILSLESDEVSQIYRVAKRYFITDLVNKIRNLFLPSNIVIGFDIGTEYVKYTQIRLNQPSAIIDRYRIQKIERKPDDTPETFRGKVALAMQKITPHDLLSVADVHVSVSTMKVVMKSETLPLMSQKELHEAVNFRAHKDLPNDIVDPQVFYEIVEKTESKEKAQLVLRSYIVDGDEIEEWVNVLKDCGIIPVKMTLPHVSIQQNLRNFYQKEFSEGVVVFDFGGATSQLVFAEKGSIKLIRPVETGTSDFITSLTGTVNVGGSPYEIDREKAELLLRMYGIPDSSSTGKTDEGIPIARIGILLFDTVEKMLLELQRSIDFYRSNFPDSSLRTMLVMGGGSEIINLFALLEEKLGLPVSQFSVINKLTIGRDIAEIDQLVRDSYLLSPAVGIALDSTDNLNILPKKNRVRKKNNLLILGISAVFFMILSYVVNQSLDINSRLRVVQSYYQNLNQELQKRVPARNEYHSLRNQLKSAEHLDAFIADQLRRGSGNDSVANILKVFSTYNTPPDIVINSMTIHEERMENIAVGNIFQTRLSPRNIILKGMTQAEEIQESIVKYILFLKGLPFFDRVQLQPYQGPEFSNERYFQISLYVKENVTNGDQ